MKVTGIIMFLITVTVAKHHHYSLRKSKLKVKGNFFGKINEDVHVVMEKIFDYVNLNANFTKEPNIKLLLTMHRDLSNIADKNFDTFNDIKNITTVKTANQTQAMINVNKIVAEILNANNFNVYEKIKGRKRRKRSHKHSTLRQSKKGNVSSEFGDSQELVNFVIDFVEKINNKRPSNLSKHFVSFRRNLKVWKPPSSMIIDSFNGTQTRRVYRGVKTKVKKFPFVVSIHIMGEFTCAGSIISRDIIISAASCLQVAYKNEFFERNPKAIYVRLGSDYTLRDGETIPIHKLFFHPLFDPESLKHNLVLIKLEKRIQFTRQQKRIRRILWDKTPGKLRDDTENILILGWGATKTGKIILKHQKLTVDILDVYDLNECKNIYSEDFVSDESFCAGYVKTKGGACNGDVGGPGVVGQVLMGVVSFGAPVCGSGDTPTVFTKLGHYAAWIESIMGTQVENSQPQFQSLYTNGRRKMSGSSEYEVLTRNSPLLENEEFHVQGEYPEEVKVLRDILNELIQPNTTLVDDLLYGELYDDFKDLFVSEEVVEDIHHPLVNKSLGLLPDIHFDSKKEYVTVILTTSTTRNPMSTFPRPSDYTTPTAGKINVKHGSDVLRIEKNHSPTRDETDYETDSDTSENVDTDNYESTKENSHGMSIEEAKQSKSREESSPEKYEIRTGNINQYLNPKKFQSVRHKKLNHSKNKIEKSSESSHIMKKDSSGISVDSDKNERNSKKQLANSEEKTSESDEHSEGLRKGSSENISDSRQTDQSSEESSVSYEKKNKYYSKGTTSESEEHSQEFKNHSSEQKSHETKDNSNKNEDDDETDSNSVEYLTTKFIPHAKTRMDFEMIPNPWGLISSGEINLNMRNRPDLNLTRVHPEQKGPGMTAPFFYAQEDLKTMHMRSEQKNLTMTTQHFYVQENHKTTQMRSEQKDLMKEDLKKILSKPRNVLEASFEMNFVVNKQRYNP